MRPVCDPKADIEADARQGPKPASAGQVPDGTPAFVPERAAAPAGEAAAEPAPAAELDAGALVLSVIWQRIKAFFARLFGRG